MQCIGFNDEHYAFEGMSHAGATDLVKRLDEEGMVAEVWMEEDPWPRG